MTTLYGEGTPQSDFNARQRDLLGPSDRRAYDQQLSGGKPEETFAKALDTGDFSQLGDCTEKATDALFGSGRLLTTLQASSTSSTSRSSPTSAWSRPPTRGTTCTRAATGQDYEDSDAVLVDLRARTQTPSRSTSAGASSASSARRCPTAGRAGRHLRQGHAHGAPARGARTDQPGCRVRARNITPVATVVRKEKERTFRDANAEPLSKVRPLGR